MKYFTGDFTKTPRVIAPPNPNTIHVYVDVATATTTATTTTNIASKSCHGREKPSTPQLFVEAGLMLGPLVQDMNTQPLCYNFFICKY